MSDSESALKMHLESTSFVQMADKKDFFCCLLQLFRKLTFLTIHYYATDSFSNIFTRDVFLHNFLMIFFFCPPKCKLIRFQMFVYNNFQFLIEIHAFCRTRTWKFQLQSLLKKKKKKKRSNINIRGRQQKKDTNLFSTENTVYISLIAFATNVIQVNF